MRIHRLSIPGNYCVHCGAQIGESVVCPGCEWVDPLTDSKTRTPDPPEEGADE